MRFQVNGGGWAIGQVLIPGATILDYADKRDDEAFAVGDRCKGPRSAARRHGARC